MKYKITLNGRTYEVEVEAGKAMLLDEYEAIVPTAAPAAPAAAAPAAAPAPAAPAAAPAVTGQERRDRAVSQPQVELLRRSCPSCPF